MTMTAGGHEVPTLDGFRVALIVAAVVAASRPC